MVSLSEAVAARCRGEVDEAWLEVMVAEVMAAIRTIATCRADDWQTPDDLPPDVYSVLVASLARKRDNPLDARQQTLGEFSYLLDAQAASSGFTDIERQTIERVAGCGGSSSSYSIQMGVGL